MKYMVGAVPEGLERLTGEERNKIYRMLRLEITPTPEGFEVSGAFVLQKRRVSFLDRSLGS